MDMMNEMMAWGWIGALLALLILLLIAALLATGLVYFSRGLRSRDPRSRDPRSHDDAPAPAQRARHVLDERYARGEIDHDDYEQRRRALYE
ncbi:MAG: SHOCT domain-containing protein [Actinomycetota bacterium]|nr:SHOCT domain-containing protein [Actinomycetota bacterium]